MSKVSGVNPELKHEPNGCFNTHSVTLSRWSLHMHYLQNKISAPLCNFLLLKYTLFQLKSRRFIGFRALESLPYLKTQPIDSDWLCF